MSKPDYEIQYDEFLEKLGDKVKDHISTMVITLDFIEAEVGFPVKEIHSYIRKDQVIDEFKPYLGNKLCNLFIIGSAFPITSGWNLVDVKGKTIFTAQGFDVVNTLNFQSFVFEYKDGQAFVKFVNSDHVVDDDYYVHIVEYTEEAATALEFHTSSRLSERRNLS